MDLSKLKRHRGAKDANALEELVSAYRKQMLELQGQINQMTPNMRVSELHMYDTFLYLHTYTLHLWYDVIHKSFLRGTAASSLRGRT